MTTEEVLNRLRCAECRQLRWAGMRGWSLMLGLIAVAVAVISFVLARYGR
jgi:hypothetical protein